MPDTATRREHKGMPTWAWALIGLVVVILVIGGVLKATDNLPALGRPSPTSLVESGRAYLAADDLSSAIADLTVS